MFRPTRFALATAVAAFITAGSAGAETAFIHFEDLPRGTDVTGVGTVHPYLNIETQHGTDAPLVVETGYGIDGNPAVPFGFAAPNGPLIPNNCLEDRDGNRVQLSTYPPAAGVATAKGISDVENSDTNTPQELKFSFNGRKVKSFSLLMTDFGDFNWGPGGEKSFHKVGLWGWASPPADHHDLDSADVSDFVAYYTYPVMNPTESWDTDYGNLQINGDACAASDALNMYPGHLHLSIEYEAGLSEVYVLAPEGADPHVGYDSIAIEFVANLASVDIHPMSCPNPINVDHNGVVPIAILGTADFDVTQIAPATVRLEGVAPLRWAYEDVSTPHERNTTVVDAYDCNTLGPDGYVDLTLKFEQQELAAALGTVNDQDVMVLHLTGQLQDGTPFEGDDVVIILSKK